MPPRNELTVSGPKAIGLPVACSTRFLGFLLAVLLLGCLPARLAVAQDSDDDVHVVPRSKPAQPAPPPPSSPPSPSSPTADSPLDIHSKPLRSDVDLVLVPVTVTDPYDRLVTGLEKDNFQIFDGNKQQQISHLSSDDAPISLGVIFDMSGSMADKIDKSREAVVQLMRTANPEDEFFVVGFSDRPQLIAGFTQDPGKIENELAMGQAQGRTALLDAIYLGLNTLRGAHHTRKALLIISDGGDNHSRYTENEVRSLVKESDVQIYAIGLYDAYPRTPEELAGPSLLSEITEATGGRTYNIDNPNELADVATKISVALRDEYVLGYKPERPLKDGKWHKIKVKLVPPKGLPPLNVYAKKGYYASSQ